MTRYPYTCCLLGVIAIIIGVVSLGTGDGFVFQPIRYTISYLVTFGGALLAGLAFDRICRDDEGEEHD